MGKQTTDEYPAHLDRAQRALAAVQAERRALLAPWVLGRRPGDGQGGAGAEQLAESARLEEAERQASHAVWADGYRAPLTGKDRIQAHSRLRHTDGQAASAEAA